MDCGNRTKCGKAVKICRVENGEGGPWCPTKTGKAIVASAMEKYRDPDVGEFARAASVQEGACYVGRDLRPYVLHPVKTRMQELI